VRTLLVSERPYYSMRSVIQSQWRERRMGRDKAGLRNFNYSTRKRVLDLLETG